MIDSHNFFINVKQYLVKAKLEPPLILRVSWNGSPLLEWPSLLVFTVVAFLLLWLIPIAPPLYFDIVAFRLEGRTSVGAINK